MINTSFTACLNSKVDTAFCSCLCNKRGNVGAIFPLVHGLILSNVLQCSEGKRSTSWRPLQMAKKRRRRARRGRRIWMSWRKKSTWWVHKQKPSHSVIILSTWLGAASGGKHSCKSHLTVVLNLINSEEWSRMTSLNFVEHTVCLILNDSLIQALITLPVTVSHRHRSRRWHKSRPRQNPLLWPRRRVTWDAAVCPVFRKRLLLTLLYALSHVIQEFTSLINF